MQHKSQSIPNILLDTSKDEVKTSSKIAKKIINGKKDQIAINLRKYLIMAWYAQHDMSNLFTYNKRMIHNEPSISKLI